MMVPEVIAAGQGAEARIRGGGTGVEFLRLARSVTVQTSSNRVTNV